MQNERTKRKKLLESTTTGASSLEARRGQPLTGSTQSQKAETEQKLRTSMERQKDALEEQVADLKVRPLQTLKGQALTDGLIQTLNEGFLWAVNLYGDKNKGGAVDQYGDWIQTVPQILAGGLWYGIELYTARNKIPKGWKRGRLEAARLLTNLGMSNLGRLIRSRWFEKRKDSSTVQTALREQLAKNAVLGRELADLRARMQATGGRSEGR